MIRYDVDLMASKIGRRRKLAARDSSATYRERRQALLAAATEVFRDRGFDGASLIDIAERAGVDRASLYYYVESKEDLFRSIVEDAVKQNVVEVERVREGDGTGAEELTNAITFLMKSYDVNYPLLYLFVAEDFSRRGPSRKQGRNGKSSGDRTDWRSELATLGDRYHRALKEIIADGVEDGSLVSFLSPGMIAHGVIGAVSWSHRWYRPDGRDSADAIAAGFAKMFLEGIRSADRR